MWQGHESIAPLALSRLDPIRDFGLWRSTYQHNRRFIPKVYCSLLCDQIPSSYLPHLAAGEFSGVLPGRNFFGVRQGGKIFGTKINKYIGEFALHFGN